MSDLIDRQAAIDTLDSGAELLRRVLDITDIVGAEREKYKWGLELIESYISDMKALPSAQQWIPCSERLPEEDIDVLISYRYKENEGDTSHVYIDITTYGQMYFGGRVVAGVKHWRPPFEYFTSNYDVIAWMPLPEPWRGEEDE